MDHRSLTSNPPAVRDPLVVDGSKLRIREITTQGTVYAKASFGGEEASVPLAQLYWDPLAGVWRVS